MKKLILISIIALLFSNVYTAGPPNPNCLPFSPCWYADKPNHPKCRPNTNVPINGGIGFLVLAGLLLGIYYHRVIRKEVKINTIPCKDCIYNRVESEDKVWCDYSRDVVFKSTFLQEDTTCAAKSYKQ